MTKRIWIALLALLLMLTVAALAEEIMPLEVHECYVRCSSEDWKVCDECGKPYSGQVDHVLRDTSYYNDETRHWQLCACGQKFDPTPHMNNCDDTTVCATCGAPYSGGAVNHVGGTSQGHDGSSHWDECNTCHAKTNEEGHSRYCWQDYCLFCREAYTGKNIISHKVAEYDKNASGHLPFCPSCGEVLGPREAHSGPDGVCSTCLYQYETVAPTDEPEPEPTDGPTVTDAPVTTDTPEVTDAPAATDEPEPESTDVPEITDAPDPTDEPDSTDEPEPEPTDEPEATQEPDPTDEPDSTDEPEPEPTDEPEVTENPETTDEPETTENPEATEAPDITDDPDATDVPGATPAPDVAEGPLETTTPGSDAAKPVTGANNAPAVEKESFLSRFQSNSDMAAQGDLLSGDVAETVTLVMEATDEAGCAGFTLMIYATDARSDGVAISLNCQYEPDSLLAFRVWQEGITEIDALRETESFGGFVELARALVRALLPEIDGDEADEIIVAILRSGFDGTLKETDLSEIVFEEDMEGEIVGYLARDGYEIILVLSEENVSLLVRARD